MLSVAEKQKRLQVEAEMLSAPEEMGFGLNPLGYKSFGSWFTSALSGQVLSRALDASTVGEDPEMRRWYIERGWVQFGKNEVDKELAKYRKLGDVRDYTEEEYNRIKELQRRNKILTRDLGYVYDTKDGDLDAPIDVNGKSFNERWGVDPEDRAGVLDFLSTLKDNPSYTLGIFTSEILKDLPLSVLSWIGLSAKGKSGASAISAAVDKLNKIEPKILRNIAKVGTGVVGGAGVGAGYEAAYTALDQGEVKSKDVKAGAQFGAAFGVLAGLGLMASKSKTLATAKAKKEPTHPDALAAERTLDDVTKKVVTPAEKKKLLDAADELAENPNKIFPDLIEGRDFLVVDLSTKAGKEIATKQKWIGKGKNDTLKGFKGVKTIIDPNIRGGMPHIVIDKTRTGTVFNRLKKNFARHVGKDGALRRVSPSEYVFLKSQGSFNSFLFAREKARVRQHQVEEQLRTEGKRTDYLDKDGKEVELNEMAASELRRAYDGVNKDRVSRSTADLIETVDELPVKGVGIVGRTLDTLAEKPMVTAAGGAAAGALAYSLSDKELDRYGRVKGDPLFNMAAAAIAVGLGPKARTLLKGKPLNTIVMNVKARVSRGLEIDANVAKAWEAHAQGISDKLDATLNTLVKTTGNSRENLGLAFISYIEGGKKARTQVLEMTDAEGHKVKIKIDDNLVKLADEYSKLLDEIGEQAVESKLIRKKDGKRKFSRLDALNIEGEGRGAFLNNYIPHLFVNIEDMTEEALFKIYGRIDSLHAHERTIRGTLANLKKMIDEEEFDEKGLSNITGSKRPIGGDYRMLVTDPVQILSVYTQAMTRAIIGKNAIENMRKVDLAPNGKKPKNYDDWKKGTIVYKKDSKELREMEDYSTRTVIPAVIKADELEAMKASGRYSKDELMQYDKFKHPALEGYLGHTNVKGILDDFFVVSRKKGGLMDAPEKLLKLNNGLKRIFVFGSLFHGQALFMSSVYALGLMGAVKGTLPKALGGARGKTGTVEWLKLQLGTESFYKLADDAIKDGLQIINIKKQELVNPGKPNIDPILDMPIFGVHPGKGLKKGFDVIDKVTWEYLHDRFKLATYIRHKERAKKRGMSDEMAGKKAAKFANDAFGSQDWNNFATKLYEFAAKNPTTLMGKSAAYAAQGMPVNKRRWLNMFLFAPDWTISNIRIIGKTFTGLPELSRAAYTRIWKGDWDNQQAKEVMAAWAMYGGYTTRAGIYTSALWWTMTELFSSEEPTMEKLWDFWFGEQSGKLDLGDGESMVISKQIAEPIHFIQHFQHTLSNKGAIVPKTALEAMYNKQWFSLKEGLPLGPRIVEEDGTTHIARWLFGKGIPIVVKPIISEDYGWKEKIERVGTGFLGFPQYGKPRQERR
jgi:hypothetical protein|tara:strand:- start:54 stop:4154 length:4101 start_codon:yes stop_codon:yes gene_type:complete